MIEFERTKRTISDHAILLTSWFDETAQTWRASAPAYAHLDSVVAAARGHYDSRKAAMDRLSSLLAHHLENGAR